ncbi:metal-dependent transcriptional regulator [Neolewinella antarctica]|uniref:Transcriptional regulator MntR n=1 Tax=Neolewinella antarctica TaxID=442734 RepID=A0ABX0X6C7_9BACT|nr:metal-dependent transcriptional regulator [Neolewinella antarctica]NJC24765.1 DtxR family Mn-dependent transcriptional regulator [Neolewinella antarctica]
MPSPTVENYLKAMFSLSDAEGSVSASELGRSLGVSTPSVSSMVRKLAALDLVAYVKYQPLKLTASGRKAAALVIRKHRLTEMFLVEKMGFGWEEVHVIAEQVEHVKSPAFFARMDKLLGYPTVDPHGSPIPSPEGTITDLRKHQKLSDRQPGEKVRIVGLAHSSNDFLLYLNERGIALKTALTILRREIYDGSLTVNYDDKKDVVLSKVVADKLLVE